MAEVENAPSSQAYDASDISASMQRLSASDSHDNSGAPQYRTEDEYAVQQLTLRAIVSSREAGVIIGKQGKNVADLRDETGVRAGVSKVVPGVHDRVLTVTGELKAITKAYRIVAKGLLEGAPQMGMGGLINPNGTHRKDLPSFNEAYRMQNQDDQTLCQYLSLMNERVFGEGSRLTYINPAIRLLISHNQMGTIIGRQGLKIKQIQDATNVRMVAQKEMLPQSTERIVEVQGTPDSVEKAVWEIGKCLIDDAERGYGTVLYNPVVRVQSGPGAANGGGPAGSGGYSNGGGGGGRMYNRTGHGDDFRDSAPSYPRRSGSDAATRPPPPTHTEDGEEIQTQNISIPSDMVGCIIGRGGSKISDIRKSSGARISIAKAPHDESGERMFTITGTAGANEKALYLLYENLEAEKMRRQNAGQGERE